MYFITKLSANLFIYMIPFRLGQQNQDKWNEGNSFIYAPAMNFIILRILEGHIQKNIEWFWSGKDNLNQIFDISFRPFIQSVDRN